MTTLTITADQADEILDASMDGPGTTIGDFTYVATIEGEQRRWLQAVTIVVSDPDGNFWGLNYDRGLTEEQGNEYPWRGYGGRRDVELTRVYPHTTVKVDYRGTPPRAGSLPRVIADLVAERQAQDEKWGEQNHADGTNPDYVWAYTGPASYVADSARAECKRLFSEGLGTWRDVLLEEVAEAFAESDPALLRAELVQVMAVAANWIAAIDRREVGA